MVKYIFNTCNCQGFIPYSKNFGSKKGVANEDFRKSGGKTLAN